MVTWREPLEIKLEDHSDRHEAGGEDEVSILIDEYTSAQTLTSSNKVVTVDASNVNVTLTLPESIYHTRRVYTIKKIDNSPHKVTIDAYSSEKIDGELTVELNLQYQYITIVCDGTEWFIIGGEYVKMEDTLDDIKETLETLLEQTEKQLVLIGKIEKHQEEASDLEVDADDIEEELQKTLADTVG